ncbi:MAG: hypothetical protein LBH53_00155 [Puniceicoccales bacterium]|nr:hypothetical protein [Puniceicoccales bacterium]
MYTTGTHSDVQSAVREVSDSDALLFPQSIFIFSQEVRTNKSLGLLGVESTDSGPLTVLEKSESDNCRFFYFSGAGGSNFFNKPANSSTFTVESAATLRIAYGQDINVYEFNESTLAVDSHRKSVPYDPDFMRSEVGAAGLLLFF